MRASLPQLTLNDTLMPGKSNHLHRQDRTCSEQRQLTGSQEVSPSIQTMLENGLEISVGEVEWARKCLLMCAVRMRPERTDDWVERGDGHTSIAIGVQRRSAVFEVTWIANRNHTHWSY